MNKSKKIGISGIGLAVLLGAGIPLAHSFGMRINQTESAPTGLYLVKDSAPKKGEMVELCPPDVAVIHLMNERGYMQKGTWGNCDGLDITPLLKPVSAVAGDIVEIEQGQPIKVNGNVLPNTQAMATVPSYPPGKYVVQKNEFWAFSTYNAASIDSRYFGPIAVSNIKGSAKPVFIKGDISKVSVGVFSND